MDREIVTASVQWPVGRWNGHPVEGPDEDAFTLAVAALGRLRWRLEDLPMKRVHLVGELPDAPPDDLAEAVGAPGLVRLPAEGRYDDWWTALAEAGRSDGPGCEAVVILGAGPDREPAAPPLHTGAIALGLARRSGIRYLGQAPVEVGTRSDEVLVSAIRRVAQERTALGGSVEIALLRSDTSDGSRPADPGGPAAVRATLDEASPSGPVAPWPFRRLARAFVRPTPRIVGLEEVDSSGGIVAVLEHRAPIETAGSEDPPETGVPLTPLAHAHRPSAQPPNVSEGAYVPPASYLSQRASRWRLSAERCSACGRLTFPVRGRCAGCGNAEGLVGEELPHRGLRVEATTVVHRGAQPTEFDRQVEATGDYQVVIARASPEVWVTFQVADSPPGSLGIGDQVDVVLRRLIPMEGTWRYGLKAVRSRPSSETP